jgi:glycosyltransferase involved in cell wall biosynthesis
VIVDAFASALGSGFGRGPLAGVTLEAAACSPDGALAKLRAVLAHTPAALLVAQPGRSIEQPADLARLLVRQASPPSFVGWTPVLDGGQRHALAVVERQPLPLEPAPACFRVAAIVPTFNEADVIEHTLRDIVANGLQPYVLDNWSTDATPEIVRRIGRELGGWLGFERFPPDGPSGSYDLQRIMARVEELAAELAPSADWLVLHDADERRRSPWPGVSLRDGLWQVDRQGYTCIDHVTLTFSPTDNRYDGQRDVEQVLRYFEFSNHPGHFHQRRAWKNLGQPVCLTSTAGHDVRFAGRRVFPYRFLLKHYPIRSQAHGERKVLNERLPRWNTHERALGWHAQYDQLVEQRRDFLRDPASLERFDPGTFYEERLIERLTGVGVFREPPDWATPPMWRQSAA